MRTQWIVISVVAAVGIGSAVYFARGTREEELKTVLAARRELVQEVVFTGTVEARRTSTLGFEVPGTVASISVQVGQSVTAGQELARLDGTLQHLEVAQARADLARGAETALMAWEAAQAAQEHAMAENSQLLERRKQAVRDAKAELDQQREVWQQEVREDGDEATTSRTQYLNVIKAETAYRTAQKLLSETRTTIAKLDEAARRETVQERAGYFSTQQAASDTAGLSSLEAQEALARARAGKSVLRTPFAGVVTAVDVEVGEFTGAGGAVVTVQTLDDLEVVAEVPETDAVKLALDMTGEVLLDAYSTRERVAVEVLRIAPAARIVEGVPTYEVVLRSGEKDVNLKAGLTADVRVTTGSRQDVIALPRRAVVERGTTQHVRVVEETGHVLEREVVTGLLGSDGAVEITSGVQEGERVVIQSE